MLKRRGARKVGEGDLAACQKNHLRRKTVDDSDACRGENPGTGLQTSVGVGVEGEYRLETG